MAVNLDLKLKCACIGFYFGIALVIFGLIALIISFVGTSDSLGIVASIVLGIGALLVYFVLKWAEIYLRNNYRKE